MSTLAEHSAGFTTGTATTSANTGVTKSCISSKFCLSVGLIGGHRAAAVAAGLSRPDADLIFASVCGKNGHMDLLDFAEALARVAARIFPELAGGAAGPGDRGGGRGRHAGSDSDDDVLPDLSEDGTAASPTELIERLLARYFTEGNACAAAPASARAATAARAAAVGRAAAAAHARSARGF